MPLPHFDQFGNLAVGELFRRGGTHYSLSVATLYELHERFVRRQSAARARVWHGWMEHRAKLADVPLPYLTLVDGSFLTTKAEPGDVDLCVLFDGTIADAFPPTEAAELQAVLEHESAKRDHHLDLYLLPIYPFGHPRFLVTLARFTYWTRVFGIDRLGRQKGIVAVAEGGVL